MFRLIVLTMLAAPLFAGQWIVLRNDKVIEIQGEPQVKERVVIIKNMQGQEMQLPLKVVDLERSKQYTKERNEAEASVQAEREAEAAEKRRLLEQKERQQSFTAIVEEVEGRRLAQDEPPPPMKLNEESLREYNEDNPRPVNDAVDLPTRDEEEGTSAEAFSEKRDDYYSEYKNLRNEIKQLEERVAQLDQNIRAIEANSLYGDNTTSATLDQRDEIEEQKRKLQAEIAKKKEAITKVKREARAAGIKDLERRYEREK